MILLLTNKGPIVFEQQIMPKLTGTVGFVIVWILLHVQGGAVCEIF